MFNKNIQALGKINEQLANKLSDMSIDEASKDIAVYEAESKDIIIALNEVPLDSVYDPKREAKTIWNKNIKDKPANTDINIVFGFGLGYLFKRAYVNSQARILLYEPDINVLRFVLEHIDFSNEFNDGRVYITDEYSEGLEYIKQKYLSGDAIYLLYNQGYAQLYQSELVKFSSDILNICEQRGLDSNTIFKYSRDWTLASLKNLKFYNRCRSFTSLENKFEGKTALIASAGPSLMDDIEVIKRNRGKFLLLSVNRALMPLLENDIEPDFVIYSDVKAVMPVHDKVEKQASNMGEIFKNRESITNKLNLILDTRAVHGMYLHNSKSKFVYSTQNDWLGRQIIETEKSQPLKTGASVSITAYYIAKQLGCKDVIFSGLDLAFKDSIKYAHKSYNSDVNELNLVKVKNLKGEEVLTKSDYALFIRQFEDILKEEKEDSIMNTTSFGALINGMKYDKLENILSLNKSTTIDTQSIVEQSYTEAVASWQKVNNDINSMLDKESKFYLNIKEQLPDLILNIKKVMDSISKDESDDIQVLLEAQSKKQELFLKQLITSPILFQYFQKEILEYTKVYQDKKFINMDLIKNIKDIELNLLKELSNIIDKLIVLTKNKEEYAKK